MLLLTAIMAGLLGWQVMMPQVDNAKYTFTVHDGQIIRMNTQNGTMERCNKQLVCGKEE